MPKTPSRKNPDKWLVARIWSNRYQGYHWRIWEPHKVLPMKTYWLSAAQCHDHIHHILTKEKKAA